MTAKSPTHKRTRLQRQRDLVEIAQLYQHKKSHVEIRDWLNLNRPYNLSRQQVSYDIAEMIGTWRTEHKKNIDACLVQELTKIDFIEREAWEYWERSKGEKTRISQEQ